MSGCEGFNNKNFCNQGDVVHNNINCETGSLCQKPLLVLSSSLVKIGLGL